MQTYLDDCITGERMSIKGISAIATGSSRQMAFVIAQQQKPAKKTDASSKDQAQQPQGAEKKRPKISEKIPKAIIAGGLDYDNILSDLEDRETDLESELNSYKIQTEAIVNPIRESMALSVFNQSLNNLSAEQRSIVGELAAQVASSNILFGDLHEKIDQIEAELKKIHYVIVSTAQALNGGHNDYARKPGASHPVLVDYVPPPIDGGPENSNYNMIITTLLASLPPTMASQRENKPQAVFPLPPTNIQNSPPGFSAEAPAGAEERQTQVPDNDAPGRKAVVPPSVAVDPKLFPSLQNQGEEETDEADDGEEEPQVDVWHDVNPSGVDARERGRAPSWPTRPSVVDRRPGERWEPLYRIAGPPISHAPAMSSGDRSRPIRARPESRLPKIPRQQPVFARELGSGQAALSPNPAPAMSAAPSGAPGLAAPLPLSHIQAQRLLELQAGPEALRAAQDDVRNQQSYTMPPKNSWLNFNADAPPLLEEKYAIVPLAAGAAIVSAPASGPLALGLTLRYGALALLAGTAASSATAAPAVAQVKFKNEETFQGKKLKLTNATADGYFYGPGANNVCAPVPASVYADEQGNLYVPSRFESGNELPYGGYETIKLPEGAKEIVTYDGQLAINPAAVQGKPITLANLETDKAMERKL
jgi:hypothetical protein